MITNQTIEEVKKRLISAFDPIEIYIFGSYAWGHPDEESDLDLLIVVDAYDDKYKAMVEGYRVLTGLSISKDILVLNRQEFETESQDITKFCYKIKKKGRKIYARA